MQIGIFLEDNIYFSGTAEEDVGNIKLIEEYIVSMTTTVDNNKWFPRSASSICSIQISLLKKVGTGPRISSI